jgi:hypothetical protein
LHGGDFLRNVSADASARESQPEDFIGVTGFGEIPKPTV